MSTLPVYCDKYGNLYSEGVTREFGENRLIEIPNALQLHSVLPLKVDPEECDMREIGKIRVEKPE